ncbi:flavoprotein [Pseudonocardia bannensis]|uniref:Flavoprotein n=1 Tax=Pseudonocardia bannensis TaxID=630973 RepID=A0A848DHF9_9PSEU|nr:flavoprotein [Pseudonocardia bannensis]NMH91973.1 flavoprotein [Pseudonocardia bannensis]
MSDRRGVIGLIASAAAGTETLRTDLVEPALDRGWQVAITLTPTAATWLGHTGERARLEMLTGFLVRDELRMPGQRSPHPTADCYIVAPATANTVAKLALGISDNQALATAHEAVGSRAVPVIVFPRVNTAHAGHPAWLTHLSTLRAAGVHVLWGEGAWAPDDPGADPGARRLPAAMILDLADQVTAAR